MSNRTYKPKRARARWMEGAPKGVISCHDNGGKSLDRYTVFMFADPLPDYPGYEGTGPGNTAVHYLAMNGNPFHPQMGIGMSGELKAYERANYAYRTKKIRWLDLPEDCRKCVEEFLKPETV